MSLDLINKYCKPPLDDPEVNADLHDFIGIEEEILGYKYERFLELIDHIDVDKRRAEYLWNYLEERGWELRLELNESQQRKLLKHIIEINKGRGTTDTILFVIELLYGIKLGFELINHITLGYWRVGYSRVGIDTKVGSAEDKITKIKLVTTTEVPLSDEMRENIKKIVHYLRAITIEYLFEWEIEETIDIDRRFRVGYSKVGISTKVN